MVIQAAGPAVGPPRPPILGETLQAFAKLEPSVPPKVGGLGGGDVLCIICTPFDATLSSATDAN